MKLIGPIGITGHEGVPIGVTDPTGISAHVWLFCDICYKESEKYIIENKKYYFCQEHKIEFDKNMRKEKLKKINK